MDINRKRYITNLLFVIPALLFFLIFVVYPFLASLYYSLTEWDGVNKATFIGVANFSRLFKDTDFTGSVSNTIFYCVFAMIVGNTGSLFLALCLHRKLKGVGYLRTLFYMPAVLSLTSISIIWSLILNYDGALNFLLSVLGQDLDSKVDWIANYDLAKWSVSFIMLWNGMGVGAVFYLAGLNSIPTEMYESSSIDGAYGIKQLLRITLPLLMPSITIVTFLNLVGSLKIFDLPYIMNGGGGGSTTSMAMKVYAIAFQNGTFGYATAAGVVLFVFVATIAFLQVTFTRKREVEL